jgi:hypothetical protein
MADCLKRNANPVRNLVILVSCSVSLVVHFFACQGHVITLWFVCTPPKTAIFRSIPGSYLFVGYILIVLLAVTPEPITEVELPPVPFSLLIANDTHMGFNPFQND